MARFTTQLLQSRPKLQNMILVSKSSCQGCLYIHVQVEIFAALPAEAMATLSQFESKASAAASYLDTRLQLAQSEHETITNNTKCRISFPDGVVALPNGMYRVFGLVEGRNKWVADVESAAMATSLHNVVMKNTMLDAECSSLLVCSCATDPDAYLAKGALDSAASTDANVARVLDASNPSIMPPAVQALTHLCEYAYHDLNLMTVAKNAERGEADTAAAEGSSDCVPPVAKSGPAAELFAQQETICASDEDHWPQWFAADDEQSPCIMHLDACSSLLAVAQAAEDRAGLLTSVACQRKNCISDMVSVLVTRCVGLQPVGAAEFSSQAQASSFPSTRKQFGQVAHERQTEGNRSTLDFSLFGEDATNQVASAVHVSMDSQALPTSQRDPPSPHLSAVYSVSLSQPIKVLRAVSSPSFAPERPARGCSVLDCFNHSSVEAAAHAVYHAQSLFQGASAQSVSSAQVCKDRDSWMMLSSDLWQVALRSFVPQTVMRFPETFQFDLSHVPSVQSMQLRLAECAQYSNGHASALRGVLGIEQAVLDSLLARRKGTLLEDSALSSNAAEYLITAHMMQSHKFRTIPLASRHNTFVKGTFRSLRVSGALSAPLNRRRAALKGKRKIVAKGAQPARKQSSTSARPSSSVRTKRERRTKSARGSKGKQPQKHKPAGEKPQGASMDTYAAVFASAIATSSGSTFAPRLTEADIAFDRTAPDSEGCGTCGGNVYSDSNPRTTCRGCGVSAHRACWRFAGCDVDQLVQLDSPSSFVCSVCAAVRATGTAASDMFPKQHPCALCQSNAAGLCMVWGVVDGAVLSHLPGPQAGFDYAPKVEFRDKQGSRLLDRTNGTGKFVQVHAVCALLHAAADWRAVSDVPESLQKYMAQTHFPDCTAVLSLQATHSEQIDTVKPRCLVCCGERIPPEAFPGSRQKIVPIHYSCALRGGQLVKCKQERLNRGAIREVGFSLVYKEHGRSVISMGTCPPDVRLNTKTVCAGSTKSLQSILRCHSGDDHPEILWTFRLVANLLTFIDRTRVLVHPSHSQTCAGFLVPSGMFSGTQTSPCMYMSTIPALNGLPLGIALDFLDSRESTILHLAALGSPDCRHHWTAGCGHLLESDTLQSLLGYTIGSYLAQVFFAEELGHTLRQVVANKKVAPSWQWPELFSRDLRTAQESILRAHEEEASTLSPASEYHLKFEQCKDFLGHVAKRLCLLPEVQKGELFMFCLKSYLVLQHARLQHLNNRFKGVANQKHFPLFEAAQQQVLVWEASSSLATRNKPRSPRQFPEPSHSRIPPRIMQEVNAFFTCIVRISTAALQAPDTFLPVVSCANIPPAPAKSKLPRNPLPINLLKFVLKQQNGFGPNPGAMLRTPMPAALPMAGPLDPAASVTASADHATSSGSRSIVRSSLLSSQDNCPSVVDSRSPVGKQAVPKPRPVQERRSKRTRQPPPRQTNSNKQPRRTHALATPASYPRVSIEELGGPHGRKKAVPATAREGAAPLRRRTRGTGRLAELDCLV